jgi:hypothetical protein
MDFHNTFFNGYKDLVMSPFGMLAGISSINVNIDGKNFQTADVSPLWNQFHITTLLRSLRATSMLKS